MASDNTLSLPVTVEAITRDWLEAALRTRAPGARLNRFEIVDIDHGTCTKIRLALDVEGADIPQRVILKGGFEPHSRAMPYMHAQEVHAYADVAPLSPLRFPACHFAGFDAEAAQGIVIMDDLALRGVTFLHPQRPETPEAVARRLTALARHHAMSWGRTEHFGWATNIADSTEYFSTVLQPEIWAAYVASSRGAATSVCFHDLDWVKDALTRVNAYGRTLPQTLIHGDTHLGNLYVDIDGEPGFFDSLPHIAPAMYEIAYHVTGALDVPVRRAHERALVGHYRDELIRLGVDAPPLVDFMHTFGLLLVNGFAVFMVNASAFQPEAINTAYTARFSAAMLDHGTLELVAAL